MHRRVALLAITTACGRFDFDDRHDDASDGRTTDVAATIAGLVHRWSFDEGAGTSAIDSAGGATATLENNPTWVAGRCGGALLMDGVSAYADASLGLGTGAVTITAWIDPRTDGASGADTVVSEETIGGVTLFDCERNHLATQGNMICSDSVSNQPYAETALPIPLNQWTHFAMTRTSGGLFTIYVNGTASGPAHQDGGPTMSGGVVFYMGTRDPGAERFDGYLDDIRIYDRELAPDEIATLYAQGC